MSIKETSKKACDIFRDPWNVILAGYTACFAVTLCLPGDVDVISAIPLALSSIPALFFAKMAWNDKKWNWFLYATGAWLAFITVFVLGILIWYMTTFEDI